MKRKSGVIINVSSLLGTKGGRGASVYAASKAGIIGKPSLTHRYFSQLLLVRYLGLATSMLRHR